MTAKNAVAWALPLSMAQADNLLISLRERDVLSMVFTVWLFLPVALTVDVALLPFRIFERLVRHLHFEETFAPPADPAEGHPEGGPAVESPPTAP